MRIFFLLPFALLYLNSLSSQNLDQKRERLEELLHEIKQDNFDKKSRIKSYINNTDASKRRFIQQQLNKGFQLYDVRNGHPLFRKSFNSDAAAAMEVNAVRPGGDLGLFLEGEGLNIGIWDGGLIRTTHNELVGRVNYFDGAVATSFSNHATGVACSLLGSGNNINAQGMAPKATGIAYDFNNDTQEMVEAQMLREIVLSNHSYGLITGWNDGQWFGDTSISEDEDWRFGFYDNNARTWDEIAFNTPNYLIVKSAGNDRGDSGNGSHPPDGPYDTVAGASTSKNILIVGAISKSPQGYENPQFIQMSSFSGWGPTDDGRIKPDVVSIGVNVETAAGQEDDQYQSTSGTSFSSPVVCGGLALVQELNRTLTNSFLKAATLKALAIHTVNQTGDVGPDYRFGWGLVNIRRACDFLLNRNQIDNQIIETRLENNEVQTYELVPKQNTPVKISIVWNDPSGTPVQASLDPTNSMLVNDLDIRLTDENGNEFLPFILDPANPNAPATTGDNFRDNVEQIFLDQADERTYTLEVSHKNQLKNNGQDFSIIIDYESSTSALTNLFWIGGNGDWSNEENWSLSSGGASSGMTPSDRNRVIIDDNSISNNDVISIDENYSIGAISVFTAKEFTLDLLGNDLTNFGNLLIASENVLVKNGQIVQKRFDSATADINLDQTKTENLSLIIPDDNMGNWVVQNSQIEINTLRIEGGHLTFDNVVSSIDNLESITTSSDAIFSLKSSELNLTSSINIGGLSEFSANRFSSININSNNQPFNLSVGDRYMNLPIKVNNSVVNLSSSNSIFKEIEFTNSTINILENVEIETIALSNKSDIVLDEDKTLAVLDGLSINSEMGLRTQLTGNNSNIELRYREKICFDYLDISDVNVVGQSTVSVGVNSAVNLSEGWIQLECEEVIFSDFVSEFLCVEGISQFTNLSQGAIDRYEWLINNEWVSSDKDLSYSFNDVEEVAVSLVVYDENGNSSQHNLNVEILESPLEPNFVVESNPTTLASFKKADSYQWYKNDKLLEGEDQRTYTFNGEAASYFVLTFENGCNRKSDVLDLSTSINDPISGDALLTIKPNPATDFLLLENDSGKVEELFIVDIMGRNRMYINIKDQKTYTLDISHFDPGLHLLKIMHKGEILTYKLIIN